MAELFLGIDLGTSGVRCAVIATDQKVVGMTRAAYPNATAQGWWDAVASCLFDLRDSIGSAAMASIVGAAVDGTSGTMVLVDGDLVPVTDPLMYDSVGFFSEAEVIARHAPTDHITQGSTSALGRLLRLQTADTQKRAEHMCHQADFILAKLRGSAGVSDENNCLKTGYDPEMRAWPGWIGQTGLDESLLPDVYPIGTAVGLVSLDVAKNFGFSQNTTLRVGTTDSIAAFLASGAKNLGEAVTSLGTTLAIKLISDKRIDAPKFGLYSHRLGDRWLVGGASNTGGGALLAHFSSDMLAQLSTSVDPLTDSGLSYYPLPRKGERFPINDPELEPRISPRPDDNAVFLKGLFEGIARIEAACYTEMTALGAPAPVRIYSAGGGAQNQAWLAIRRRIIGGDIQVSPYAEAAIGMAMLCAQHNASQV